MFFGSKKETKKETELIERVETLERQFKRLQLEWEDAYDKLRSFYQRIAKRAERLERDSASGAEETSDVPTAGPVGNGLDERRAKLNQQILSRRNRISGKEVEH